MADGMQMRRRGGNFRRWLSAVLAAWLAVFGVAVHGLHTCGLNRPLLCPWKQASSQSFPSPCCCGSCLCQLLRYVGSPAGGAARSFCIVGVESCNDDCLACHYLAQPQMPAPMAMPFMAAEWVLDVKACAPAVPLVCSATYSPGSPRAPPIALV